MAAFQPKTDAAPSPLMIRGDRLLLALNVVEVSRWPIENWRSHPERFEKDNPCGLSVPATHRVLRKLFGRPNPFLYTDDLCGILFPFLRACGAGVLGAEFSVDAVTDHFLGQCQRVNAGRRGDAWPEDRDRLRRLLVLIASGELTEADFRE